MSPVKYKKTNMSVLGVDTNFLHYRWRYYYRLTSTLVVIFKFKCPQSLPVTKGLQLSVNRLFHKHDKGSQYMAFLYSEPTGSLNSIHFFLLICFTSYFVFSIAVLPHSPGEVYYHLLLRRETRTPGVVPFSFRIGIWDLFVFRGQKSYTPTVFGKLWTTPSNQKSFHKMLQNHLRGSVTQLVTFADVSQN